MTALLRAIVNGQPASFAEGVSVLEAVESLGIRMPALCHDARLKPTGGCRLCCVEMRGRPHPVAACTTVLEDGAEITTHSNALEDFRRATLRMVTIGISGELVRALPEKRLHRAMLEYGVEPGECAAATAPDESHPYIRVDMSQCILCTRCVRICADVQGQFVWHVVGRGAEARIVHDRGANLRESSCVGCGACTDTCPTGALVDKSRLERGASERWTRTTCAYCGVGCELEAGTRGNTIVQTRPATDAPVNRGHLCVKGRYAFDFVTAPDRVTQPMMRREGAWSGTTWATALAHCASELRRIIGEHGPDAVGVLGSARATNEENYLAQKFARLVVGTNNVDCCARVCHAPTAAAMKAMLGAGAATHSFEHVEQARIFLIVGCNPTENHPIVGARIRQRLLGGARGIVIDPRRTELAAHAAVHLAPRPGTNVPLLNAMAQVIVSEGLIDRDFMAARVTGFDEFREFIDVWHPERAADICGVDAEDIRHAARLFARERPAMCFHGLGVTEHLQGTEAVMCLVNLALLTGNFGDTGGGINPLRGQNNVQGAAHMGCEPNNLTGGALLAEARGRFEAAWQSALPSTAGLNLLEMIDSAAAGRLKALWIIGYDIYPTLANADAVAAALSQLELVIVQDFVLNETARACGTVFLPVATALEKDGTFMNSERRIQRVRRVVDPPGAARADWEIIRDLARAMGAAPHFAHDGPESIWEEIRRLWPTGAGISYARLERGGLQWPCLTESDPGKKVLHGASFGFGPTAALRRIDYVPTPERVDEAYPFVLATGRSLCQFNAGTMTRRTPNTLLRPTDLLEMCAEDAARIGARSGDTVRLTSRYGQARLPLAIVERVKPGHLFATFQDPDTLLNRVTGAQRDRFVQTPEYKVTAVRVEPEATRLATGPT